MSYVKIEQLQYFGQEFKKEEDKLIAAAENRCVQKEEGKSLVSATDIAQIGTNKTAIETLAGTDTGKSARTIANEELAAQLIPESAKESLDTLQEIAAWIQAHPDDASAMNQAITAIETLVGTIPETATASDIVGYIAEEIAKINTDLSGYVKAEDITFATNDDIDAMINEIFGKSV